MIPVLAKYTAELCINTSCHLLKRGWKAWIIISSKVGVNVLSFTFVWYFYQIGGVVLSFVSGERKKKESLVLQKSMPCNPAILNAILQDLLLRRRCPRSQNIGSSALLLLSASSWFKSYPTDLSVTANAPEMQQAIKPSPKNWSAVSSHLFPSPRRQLEPAWLVREDTDGVQ